MTYVAVHLFNGLQEYTDNIRYCHNDGSKTVSYQSGSIPYVMLPLHKIKEAFPSMRTILWDVEVTVSSIQLTCNLWSVHVLRVIKKLL